MNGIKYEAQPLRLYDYEKVCGAVGENFPSKFSLEKRVTVKNQGDAGACVACALCSVAEYLWEKEMSEGFCYGMYRSDKEKTPGLYFNKAFDYAKNVGFVPYDDFGVLEEMPNIRDFVKKYPELQEIAKNYRISGYANLLYADRKKRDNAIKDAIMNGGMGVPAKSDEYFNESHAIMLIGWDDERDVYEFQNSWGREYGTDGVGYIPKAQIDGACAVFLDPVKLPFGDVPEDAWYYKNVKNIYMSGYVNGTSETAFEPERPITRAEICAIIDRVCKGEDENNGRIFKVINELLGRVATLERTTKRL